MTNMQIILPGKVAIIIDKLISNGHEAYIVGGCVRDSLLGRIPLDWDITTSADPLEVKRIFRRTVDTGIKHGTVTVLMEKDSFEITTYRIDGEYEDSRHPKEVCFTKSLEEDLKRRDFTINAMAYNHQAGLIDLFNGQVDLQTGLIRCVGNPIERFSEDALRILRAFRFSAQLNFTIEVETLEAARTKAPTLSNISAERIREELNKLLLSSNPNRLIDAYEAGITCIILPEFDQLLDQPEGRVAADHMFQDMLNLNVTNTRSLQLLRWTLLLHTISNSGLSVMAKNDYAITSHKLSSDIVKSILQGLKFDNDTITQVGKLIFFFSYQLDLTLYGIRSSMHVMSEEIFDYYLILLALNSPVDFMQQTYDLVHQVRSAPYCVSLKNLDINGFDLIENGFQPGKELGSLLDMLLQEVILNPELNTKPQLLALAKRFWSNENHDTCA